MIDANDALRIITTAVFGYIALIFILRISGNRTLSKMNSFDFVITVSLGSSFATGVLQKKVSLAALVLFFVLVVGLQFIVTFLSVRFKAIDKIVKSEPVLVFLNGKFLPAQMRKARVAEDEVLSAVRSQGFVRLELVSAVVLETNGELSAIGISETKFAQPSKQLIPNLNRH